MEFPTWSNNHRYLGWRGGWHNLYSRHYNGYQGDLPLGLKVSSRWPPDEFWSLDYLTDLIGLIIGLFVIRAVDSGLNSFYGYQMYLPLVELMSRTWSTYSPSSWNPRLSWGEDSDNLSIQNLNLKLLIINLTIIFSYFDIILSVRLVWDQWLDLNQVLYKYTLDPSFIFYFSNFFCLAPTFLFLRISDLFSALH